MPLFLCPPTNIKLGWKFLEGTDTTAKYISPALVTFKFGHHVTQHNDIQHDDTQHKELLCDTQHNHCIECSFAECRISFIVMLNIFILNVAMLSVVMLNALLCSNILD
jgi:hypothetical protein